MKSKFWRSVSLMGIAVLSTAMFAYRQDAASPQVIELKAKRFAFAPAEITLKKGEPVVLRLNSEDVVHGLYLKPLKIDAEITPGTATDVKVTPDQVGKFVAICDHFCGSGHGNMHLVVNVVE